jgi:hypothetical protein
MKYKFNVGDKVSIRGTEDSGKVIARRFAPVSIMHMSLLPSNYYTVMLQDEYDLGDGPKTLNWAKVECSQKNLEKLASTS